MTMSVFIMHTVIILMSLACSCRSLNGWSFDKQLCPNYNRSRMVMDLDGAHRRLRRDTESARIRELQETLFVVSRQVMMQQFHFEEITRASGHSGLKRIRTNSQGTRPYYSTSHAGPYMVAAIHNHPNFNRLLGFGEMVAVLNGVEFHTRHNDFSIKMRHPTRRRGIVDVPFPEVPPAVTRQASVDGQIQEMRAWFKAWKDQDYSVRDYREYFKPVLCYLEGAWTHSVPTTIDQSFESERHFLDASSWLDMTQKIRFTSHSGAMQSFQNLAYLPTTIINMVHGEDPLLVQWNYKILCHPLSRDLPLSRLRLVDDLKTRMSRGQGVTMRQYKELRVARFRISTFDKEDGDGEGQYGLLDDLMAEIPGFEGYSGDLRDRAMWQTKRHYNDTGSLNTAFYHRWYKVQGPGPWRQALHRGFSDENLFVAQTTDAKIAGLAMEHCDEDRCKTWRQRWTYAIPLEIVYMTPSSKWNPYNIVHRGRSNSPEGRRVREGPLGRRNGGPNPHRAYDGTNTNTYFRTPREFFDNLDAKDLDAADTVQNYVHVLDSAGRVRAVRNSGYWITYPHIHGVGRVRQRYPIMPLHEEGGAAWRELEALKHIVLDPGKYNHMVY